MKGDALSYCNERPSRQVEKFLDEHYTRDIKYIPGAPYYVTYKSKAVPYRSSRKVSPLASILGPLFLVGILLAVLIF